MHRFGKSSDREPPEPDDGQTDHKEINNARRDNDDKPLNLIVTAIFQLERNRRRAELFEASLMVDHAWDMLLLIYIYQSSATPITHDILAQETGLSDGTTRRYIKAMQQDGLIDPSTLILSEVATAKLEALFSFANEPVT